MKFDELNRLQSFFSKMKLSQEEKDKRVSLGLLLYDAFFYVFSMMKLELKLKGEIDRDYYIRVLDGRLRDVLDVYEESYILKLTEDVIDATERHLDDDYYFSEERALLVAQNESNTVYNNIDFVNAKAEGKMFKTWITEEDSKVRPAHEDVDLITIPIEEYFPVGGDMMMYPHDYINGSAENIINCRCTCEYS